MTGTKVEAIHRHGVPATEGFVVGLVLSVEQHPDADRLKVCSVDLGEDEPATIVCGAPNVAAGQTVAVARPGAVMPDGTKLKKAKLRGVVSEGMILAAVELELDPSPSTREGILVLDGLVLDGPTPDADRSTDRGSGELYDGPAGTSVRPAPGTPLADVLAIATDVIELEITPNRPDCLGVYGVARELHAATGAALAPAPWNEDPGSCGDLAGVQVSVLCPDLCPRFTARVFENVSIAPSPLWLSARLIAAGQRPINNVVDITNYAMLLTGQPLHAFDLDRVAGARLLVRRAREGEQVQTLDGHTRALDSEMVVIEDADGPTSIAGLMGGARSEVMPDTTRVLLEVANWNGPNIHRASWALGLRSEASGRFEKGLAPEQCLHAQAVATRLMLRLCGGATVAPGTLDIGAPPAAANTIRLRRARVRGILGVEVTRERQQQILEALDFETAPADDGLDVTAPALRREDVTREVDLIEEVARIDGLERLPATLPARRGAAGRLTHAQRVRRTAEDALVGRGLYEIVGWSFADPGLLDRLLLPADHELRDVVTLENPLSDGRSIMRPTLIGSLLEAARHNVARNGPDIAIFESGAVYRASRENAAADAPRGDAMHATREDATGAPHEDAAGAPGEDRPAGAHEEHHALGVLLGGDMAGWGSKSWRGERVPADFFTAKALLAGVLERFHLDWSVQPRASWPFLHPGRSAAVLTGEVTLGFLGEVHPLVADAWGLERTAAFSREAR